MLFRRRRLLATAVGLVREYEAALLHTPGDIDAARVQAAVFARHGIRICEDVAAEYLRAALSTRGHRDLVRPLPTAN
ncbi:hypothetical protein GCM10010371_66030 [Streptomyces subrutilus]|uniref:Uncharacterized protein n=1 Tax=Streptomyces subrutilus TaxID=36818 RepID=A0A918VGE9_9ACTN|nr:hypothetical protein [Streptomyces subrutilus]GGZ96899.1 hypothetical protein GCM10010371_66030 [Streptomyces subrutilus]